MPRPRFITFTGIDNETDLDRLQELSSRYPIEWGILFGDRIDQRNRYPNLDTIGRALATGARFSAHLCGFYARHAMDKESTADDFYRLLGGNQFGRFQINAVRYDMEAVKRFQTMMGKPVIVQVRDKVFPEALEGIYYLHDKSGGKGRVPTSRPIQTSANPFVGHAGGIDPDNVLDVMDGIDAYDFWGDLESGCRTNEWLDLDKCEAICQALWPVVLPVSVPDGLTAQEIA